MMRVYIIVEGQTEEAVVKDLLASHFSQLNIELYPIIVKTSIRHKGGGRRWSKWKNDILKVLKQQKGPLVRVTTLFEWSPCFAYLWLDDPKRLCNAGEDRLHILVFLLEAESDMELIGSR